MKKAREYADQWHARPFASRKKYDKGRVAFMVYRLFTGRPAAMSELADLLAIDVRTVYRLVDGVSRVVPVYRDDGQCIWLRR